MSVPVTPDITKLSLADLKRRARKNGQHPRTLIVATAKAAMGHAVYQVEEKYDLTTIELIQCLAEIIQGSMKYALRVERHGDPEYPADAPLARRRSRRQA
jgi:hypothetical protein